MHKARMKKHAVSVIVLVALAIPGKLAAEEVSYWPGDEDDKQLQQADSDVLRLQKARSQAIFANDTEAVERLEKEFREAQSGRRNLLRKTGRR